MGGASERSFVVRLGTDASVPELLDFHQRRLTEHLWPRTRAEFKALTEANALYQALETTAGDERLVGLCYISPGVEPLLPGTERHEFGGFYVEDSCRGCGVATALGKLAISNQFAFDPPRGRLVAHVHESNELPRRVLTRLGFFRNGEETPPPDAAPKMMRRNARGEVVGHLYEFDRAALIAFADWIDGFDGSIEGRAGRSRLRADLALVSRHKAEALEALRTLGAQR